MKTTQTTINRSLWLTTLLMSTLLLGCQNDDDPTSLPPVVTTPTVTSVTPACVKTHYCKFLLLRFYISTL